MLTTIAAAALAPALANTSDPFAHFAILVERTQVVEGVRVDDDLRVSNHSMLTRSHIANPSNDWLGALRTTGGVPTEVVETPVGMYDEFALGESNDQRHGIIYKYTTEEGKPTIGVWIARGSQHEWRNGLMETGQYDILGAGDVFTDDETVQVIGIDPANGCLRFWSVEHFLPAGLERSDNTEIPDSWSGYTGEWFDVFCPIERENRVDLPTADEFLGVKDVDGDGFQEFVVSRENALGWTVMYYDIETESALHKVFIDFESPNVIGTLSHKDFPVRPFALEDADDDGNIDIFASTVPTEGDTEIRAYVFYTELIGGNDPQLVMFNDRPLAGHALTLPWSSDGAQFRFCGAGHRNN